MSRIRFEMKRVRPLKEKKPILTQEEIERRKYERLQRNALKSKADYDKLMKRAELEKGWNDFNKKKPPPIEKFYEVRQPRNPTIIVLRKWYRQRPWMDWQWQFSAFWKQWREVQ